MRKEKTRPHETLKYSNTKMWFQLPSFPHFGFRAFQSFRQPRFFPSPFITALFFIFYFFSSVYLRVFLIRTHILLKDVKITVELFWHCALSLIYDVLGTGLGHQALLCPTSPSAQGWLLSPCHHLQIYFYNYSL